MLYSTGMASWPMAAVIEPEPLMIPVTVPRALLEPPVDSARSAETAEVMMLLGPPTKHPMNMSRIRSNTVGRVSMYSASTHSRGMRMPMKVAITRALQDYSVYRMYRVYSVYSMYRAYRVYSVYLRPP